MSQTLIPHQELAVILAMIVAVVAAQPAPAELQVVTTTTDLASIAREIAGSRAEASAIAAGYQDPHFVDARPSYLLRLQRADLFVVVGMDLERGWAPQLLVNSRNAKIQQGSAGYVDASDGVVKRQVPTAADRSMGDIHAFGNPHYWLDPANGKIIGRNIAEGLKRVDPGHAAAYDSNLAAFDAKLDAAIERWATSAAALSGMQVVAYHDSWPYFAQRFGLDVAGFVEPKPGIPPSGRYITELAEMMKAQGIRLILSTAFYSKKTAELISRQANARVVTLGQSVGGVDGADDYFSLFEVNLGLLLAAAEGR